MKVERRIFGNTILLALSQVASQLANFVFVVLFARSFGAETLGIYSLAMAIGGLVCSFVSFGTNRLALRDISRDPPADREIVGRLLPLQLLTGLVVWGSLIVGTYWLTGGSNAAPIIIIVGAFHIVLIWQALLSTRFQSRQLMRFTATTGASTQVGILILGLASIYAFQESVLAVASLPVSALLVLLVIYFAGTRQFGAPHFRLDLSGVPALVRRSWPFMSIAMLGILYQRLGVILLGFFQPDDAVGYYASAERLLVPFIAIFSVFSAAVFPALSRLHPEQPSRRDKLARRCLRVLLALTLPAATLVYLYRADVIFWLYGEGFVEAVAILTLLAWVIALRGFNAFLSMLSMSADLQSRLGVVKLIALSVFVTLCVSLIPRYSFLGLAYATLVSELILAIMMYWSLRANRLLTDVFGLLWRPAVCCMATIIVTINLASLPLVYRLVVSIATFGSAIVLTGAIKRHDVVYLLRIAKGD